MKVMVKDLLNTLGLGINGIMPNCVDNWCGRLKAFAPSFQVFCSKNDETEKEFTLSASVNDVVVIKYTLNGAHIIGVEVNEI